MTRLARFFPLLIATSTAADPVTLTGAIGPYPIEVTLDRSTDGLTGRYRYADKTDWITLTGNSFGTDALELQETVAGEITGRFYLDHDGQGLTGFWANDTSDFAVDLTPAQGATAALFAPASAPDIGPGLTGQYTVGHYWVNAWFAPQYEIGFNGGAVNVVRLSDDNILVAFEFVVGPTYHIASFFGQATRRDNGTFVHDAILPGGDAPCRLVFHFDGPSLSIDDFDNGFACQFGARAHANFALQKSSDTATFGPQW